MTGSPALSPNQRMSDPAGRGPLASDAPAETRPAPSQPLATKPGSCAAALGDDLGWALGTLSRSYRKAVSLVTADLPGGPRGYQILALACGELAGTQLVLAQHLGVDRTVMTYLLDDMQRAGLVERRPDPADRRARRIVATRLGREREAETRRRLREAEESVLAGLGAAERDQFRTLLRRLAMYAETVDPSAGGCSTACAD